MCSSCVVQLTLFHQSDHLRRARRPFYSLRIADGNCHAGIASLPRALEYRRQPIHRLLWTVRILLHATVIIPSRRPLYGLHFARLSLCRNGKPQTVRIIFDGIMPRRGLRNMDSKVNIKLAGRYQAQAQNSL